LKLVTAVYEELPTWNGTRTNLSKKFRDLPQESRDFVHRIEMEFGAPVTIIGNGPRREQVIDI
jgi:adenylosuccinate synthase